MAKELPFDAVSVLGILLLAILLNAYFCGVVSQQQYTYWTSGFKDSIYLRIFIVAQYILVLFQTVMLWQLAWTVYVDNYGLAMNNLSITWQGPVNSSCQCVLIIMANVFLAVRIYSLTKSRLQSGLVFGFSLAAFVAGIVTIATTWPVKSVTESFTGSQSAASTVWHSLQAVSECLIMYFLSRALLASRSGLQNSDGVINDLVRNVFQLGVIATVWAFAELGTWYLLPKSTVYTIFDMTSGSIYTHMIYDGLLSRTRLRERMAERSQFDVGFPSQSLSQSLDGKRLSSGRRTQNGTQVMVSRVTMTDYRTTAQVISSSQSGTIKDSGSDIESAPAGKSDIEYEFPEE
ncbi:hypothetical protein BGW80DRAFT_1320944 [Lactifluus volemus]|nr:hypothetical protein BGW80DRAFT_1320944 [Lactifluus volemus]